MKYYQTMFIVLLATLFSSSFVTQSLAQDNENEKDGLTHIVDLSSQPPFYSPNTIVVEAGATVVWKNVDQSNMHTVNDLNGRFRSPEITAEQEWQFQFLQEGRYDYACRFHPWMRGRVIVEDRKLEDVSSYSVPDKWGTPAMIRIDNQNNVWFTLGESRVNEQSIVTQVKRIGRLSAKGEFRDFKLPKSVDEIINLCFDRNNHLWFTQKTSGKLYQLNPDNGKIENHDLIDSKMGALGGMTLARENKIWLTLPKQSQLIAFNITTRQLQRYDLPESDLNPGKIVSGAQGWLYFITLSGSRIGAWHVDKHAFKEFVTSGSGPVVDLAATPEGIIWFTDFGGNRIGKIANGWVTEYTVPHSVSGPAAIAVDGKGVVWFTQLLANKIAVFKEGTFMQFSPQDDSGVPAGLAIDAKGHVWFNILNNSKIQKLQDLPAIYTLLARAKTDVSHKNLNMLRK